MRRNTQENRYAELSDSHRAQPSRQALVLLVSIALLAPSLAHLAQATVITVTGFDSTVADDGVCTLREAINSANLRVSSGSKAGECPAGSTGAEKVIDFAQHKWK